MFIAAASSVLYTTSCFGRNFRPKHVELIGITDKIIIIIIIIIIIASS